MIRKLNMENTKSTKAEEKMFADVKMQLNTSRLDKAVTRILWDFCHWTEANYSGTKFLEVTDDMLIEHLSDYLLDAAEGNNPSAYIFVGKRMSVLNKVFKTNISDSDIGYGSSFILECPNCQSDFEYGDSVHNPGRCKCPHCKHVLSTHRGTPLIMSSQDINLLRIRNQVSKEFESLQEQKGWGVSEAYSYLADGMELPYGKNNIGSFSEEQCKKAISVIRKLAK